MSEAEKKWDKWDEINSAPISSKRSREAYKAALRREIEKDKHLVNKEYFLNKIETVEP